MIVTVLLFWTYLFFSNASICSTMSFPPLGNFDHVVSWEDIFKVSASAATSQFCEYVKVGIDVYIPHCKYQVTQASLISMVFSSCAAAIVHRSHFFRLHQKSKSSESKIKFRQGSNCCKRDLETAKLAYANKTKDSITSNKLGS